ncbi:hypothetical protein [Streptomyces sp. NPDC058695]|uniref:hypothetical protein n=1 Tax=Streptomyces sp. NPDC058695 TaxID=3346604 RepID=UPI00364BFBC5
MVKRGDLVCCQSPRLPSGSWPAPTRDAAAIALRTAWLTVSGVAADPDGDIRAALDGLDVAPFHAAAEVVKELAQEPDDGSEQMLAARYNTIARFLPGLLTTFAIEASKADKPAGRQGVRVSDDPRIRSPCPVTELMDLPAPR